MQETIQQELQALVESGQETAKHTAFVGFSRSQVGQLNLALRRYQGFKTRALNLIRRAFGVESDHYKELRRLGDGLGTGEPEFTRFAACLGIVEAAQHDLEAGLLFDMKALISAELLGEFIDQADILLSTKYHIPAASLAGAVLEDTLRKLREKNGSPTPKKSSINSLNAELVKAGTYGQPTHKQITAYADLRNRADHGEFHLVSPADVEAMVAWVRRFAEEYLR